MLLYAGFDAGQGGLPHGMHRLTRGLMRHRVSVGGYRDGIKAGSRGACELSTGLA